MVAGGPHSALHVRHVSERVLREYGLSWPESLLELELEADANGDAVYSSAELRALLRVLAPLSDTGELDSLVAECV